MNCLIILLLLCSCRNNQCPFGTGNRPCQGNNGNNSNNNNSCSSGRRPACGCEPERRESSCSDTNRNFISFQSQSSCGCENSSN